MGDFEKALFLLIFSLVMFNVNAQSQHADTPTFSGHSVKNKAVYSLSLQDLLNVKIATSTLTDKAITDIPSPVTVFARQDIETMGLRYLHEILEFVPGYQVTRYSNYPYEYSASSRALTFGASSKKILFLLDGHKINGPRSGNAAHLANFALAHIERLEIIRGPGSSIYGSNAFTGVINIITRKTEKSVSLATGNDIDYDLFVANSGETGGYNWNIQANRIEASGSDYILNNTFTQQPFHTQDPYDLTTLHAQVHNKNSAYTIHFRQLDMTNFYHIARTSNKHNFSRHSALLFLTEHQFSLVDNIQSRLQFDYLQTTLKNGNQSTPSGVFSKISEPSSDAPLFGYGVFEDFRAALALHNNWQATQESSVQFGFEWQINKEQRAEGFTNYDLPALLNQNYPIQYYPDVNYKTKIGGETSQPFVGAYAQYQTSFAKINWVIGGRFDRYPDLKTQFTPRLGAVYLANNHWQYKLLYGEAFRAPELSELTLFSGITRSGNANLESESIKTTDFIAQFTGEKLLFSVDLFYNHFSDPIINGLVSENLSGQVNSTDQYGHGIETELVWELQNNIKLRTTATYFTKRPISAFRDSKALASIRLEHTIDDLTYQLSATYRSNRETPTSTELNNKIASFWYLRAYLHYRLNPKLSLKFGINNLLDDAFYNPSTVPAHPNGIPLKGRNGTLEFSWQF